MAASELRPTVPNLVLGAICLIRTHVEHQKWSMPEQFDHAKGCHTEGHRRGILQRSMN